MDKPIQIDRAAFDQMLVTHFSDLIQDHNQIYFRDGIANALNHQFSSCGPIIPGVVSKEKFSAALKYYQGPSQLDFMEAAEAADEVAKLTLDAFRRYQETQKQETYLVWSGGFYDEFENEVTRVYRCPIS